MHQINYDTYKENVDKNKVQKELDNRARYASSEGATGLGANIRWLSSTPVQKDRDTAEKYLSDHDNGWYDQLAVRFYEYDPADLRSKKIDDAVEKRRLCMTEKKNYLNSVIQNRKEKAYVSCKECGSKLATAFLSLNTCPVCKGILLTDTQAKKIAAFDIKSKKYAEIMEEEEKKLKDKQRKKAIVKWLVKTEYHV